MRRPQELLLANAATVIANKFFVEDYGPIQYKQNPVIRTKTTGIVPNVPHVMKGDRQKAKEKLQAMLDSFAKQYFEWSSVGKASNSPANKKSKIS